VTEHLWTDSEGEGLEDEEDPVRGAVYGARKPRSPRLSQEDVFEAADALLLRSDRVTIDRVRAALGRGSPNTIGAHLDLWWAELGGRLKDIPGREFPEVPSALGRELPKALEYGARECSCGYWCARAWARPRNRRSRSGDRAARSRVG
jgi:hypothetical protein